MGTSQTGYFAALDVGSRRIGIALAHSAAALPAPHSTMINDEQIWSKLAELVRQEQIIGFVVGLPRGMSGQDTYQTKESRQFAETLKKRLNLPVYLQDEAVTSVKAEAQLQSRGKSYNKDAVDALAATFILEDFLKEKGRENSG